MTLRTFQRRKLAPLFLVIFAVAGCGNDSASTGTTTTERPSFDLDYSTTTTSQPEAPASTEPDESIERTRAFFMDFDTAIPGLEDAIAGWQNDGSAAPIREAVADLDSMYKDYRADGGRSLSGAAKVIALGRRAAETGDVAELARIRGDLADSRLKLTAQVMGRD